MAKINLKNIYSAANLLFIAASVVVSIIILNLYSKLVQTAIPSWVAIMVVAASTIFGIFISGWLIGLRKKSMHYIEFYLTVLLIFVIMILLQQYQPAWLFGANAFVEPSREFLADVGRSVFAK